MRTIITTVGTSLITNTKQSLQTPNDQTPGREELLNFLTMTGPKKATAETNSLSRLLRDADRLVLLHSATEEGLLCAELLGVFYSREGHAVEMKNVPDLTYDRKAFRNQGLRSFVSVLVDTINQERRQGREVCINATGGFKAETAYAATIGQLYGAPVFYIYEAFDDIVELPPAPITWDYGVILRYEPIIEWMEQELERGEWPSGRELDRRLEAHREQGGDPSDLKLKLLVIREEGVAYLSPMGQAIYRQYLEMARSAPQVPVFLSAVARKAYQAAEGEARSEFDRLLRKLQIPELRYAGSEPMAGDCYVFPRDRRNERFVYYQEADGSLRVCEVFQRHEDYEKLRERSVRQVQYTGFKHWTPGLQV